MIRLLAAVAIVSTTVYTGEGPPIENATVVIERNRIEAVGRGIRVPSGARVLHGEQSIVTPGLVDSDSRIGLVEVSLEASTVEGTVTQKDPIRASLRVADTFNPASFVLPVARAGGITSALVVPEGGLVSGQSAWVDLVDASAVRKTPAALHVRLTGRAERGSRAEAYLRLREVLDDAKLFGANRGAYIGARLRDLSVSAADLDALYQVLERQIPIVFEVDRAADILTVLSIVRDYDLRAVLVGAAEGWSVAGDIAASGAAVLVNPLDNVPSRFDALRTRDDNATQLERAGVRVAFTLRGESHRAAILRQAAGNAVARGYPYDAAIAAMTRIPAEVFGMTDAGSIRPGALANVVIWNGDPLELSTWPTHLFIRGEEIPLRSRQDLLTERYLSPVP